MCMPEEPPCYTRRWYLSGKEIEDHSPSRKDGIDFEYESHLRMSYCKFIQELGEKLKL
jgi:cyclin T